MGTVAVLTGTGQSADELNEWLDALPRTVTIRRIQGNQIAHQRNLAVAQMAGDWILFVDADCVPPVRALERLLGHAGPAIVAGAVCERVPPFDVCAVRSLEPYARWTVDDLPPAGLLQVVAAGTGFLFLRRQVLEAMRAVMDGAGDIPAMGPPAPGLPKWFRCGQIVSDLLNEDFDFCLRAAACGFPVFLDCGLRVGHVTRGVIYPGLDGLQIQWAGPHGLVPYREPLVVEEVRDGVHV